MVIITTVNMTASIGAIVIFIITYHRVSIRRFDLHLPPPSLYLFLYVLLAKRCISIRPMSYTPSLVRRYHHSQSTMLLADYASHELAASCGAMKGHCQSLVCVREDRAPVRA